MKLSIIIPVYNEEKTIAEIIKRVQQVELRGITKEIIVVNDGSQDKTEEILEKIEKKEQDIKIINYLENQGKGMAIRTALPQVEGDIVIIQDADLEYNPAEYPHLIEPILEEEAEVVYGSRILGRNIPPTFQNHIFYLGGRSLSMLTNLLYRSEITDEPTCYKVFKTDILKSLNLKCKGFEFCPEVTAKILGQGIKIKEIPISCHPRSVKEGKKIRLKDWFIAVWTLFKYRLFG